jgi:DNA modification methylase
MAVEIHVGDCRKVLADMPDQSVHCIVTSPPYFGLRDYGVDGQIGLEQTPAAYVEELVAVFRQCRRVLRDDGTLWLNIGDSYSGGGGFSPDAPSNREGSKQTTQGSRLYKGRQPTPGLKPKDLIGIPWLVAFALRDDGWYLRAANVWAKPNPMPESVRDRTTSSYEMVFMLSKRATYFYDQDAVRERGDTISAGTAQTKLPPRPQYAGINAAKEKLRQEIAENGFSMRNLRNVWTIATQPFPGAHFVH